MFQPGMPRPEGAGRKAGTPNKKTEEFARLAEELGVSPQTVLLYFAAGNVVALGYMTQEEAESDAGKIMALKFIPPELREQAAAKACEYLLPKLKAVEISGEIHALMPVTPIPGLPPTDNEHA